jgi:hypothetical protein
VPVVQYSTVASTDRHDLFGVVEIHGLTAFRDHLIVRAWKGMDWDLLDLLHRKGWIEDPRGKAKSVVFTDEGDKLARELLRRHFGA